MITQMWQVLMLLVVLLTAQPGVIILDESGNITTIPLEEFQITQTTNIVNIYNITNVKNITYTTVNEIEVPISTTTTTRSCIGNCDNIPDETFCIGNCNNTENKTFNITYI